MYQYKREIMGRISNFQSLSPEQVHQAQLTSSLQLAATNLPEMGKVPV
jgi:hypothetical protein